MKSGVTYSYGGRGIFRPEEADDRGLVVVGGSLTTELIVEAYSSGVFPWSSDPVVSWWSPDPRAVFDLAAFKSHRSVQKRARQAGWTYTVNREFAQVMTACAEPTEERPETWISADFVAAYTRLHQLGAAHSVEVWEGSVLVGGLYGVQLGGFFGGESMFHRSSGASKAAVAFLVERCRAAGLVLLDAQVPNPHLMNIGAVEISRDEYLGRLERALAVEAASIGA
ncbi:MAG: leucyl/phenylalanyl-tRNA--protein transferase [Polyangia bacterium]